MIPTMSRAPAFASVFLAAVISLSVGFAQAQQAVTAGSETPADPMPRTVAWPRVPGSVVADANVAAAAAVRAAVRAAAPAPAAEAAPAVAAAAEAAPVPAPAPEAAPVAAPAPVRPKVRPAARPPVRATAPAAVAAATPVAAPAAVPAAVPPAAPAAVRGAAPKPEAGMEMSALVMADNEATLSAQMAGKINRIRFAIGDGFPERAVLVEFDCAEPRARLDALNAEYLGARETHLAKLRLQGLGAAGDLEVTLAAAAGERARSQVKQQEAQMSFCTIRAPYAGRVVRLKARQAENVAPNQPVMEIVATARLKAAVHVPSALAVRLKQGSPLSIDIKESGRRYAAKVAKLNARVDGVSQSLELEAIFVGDTTGLLPGMIGQAVFVEDAGKPN